MSPPFGVAVAIAAFAIGQATQRKVLPARVRKRSEHMDRVSSAWTAEPSCRQRGFLSFHHIQTTKRVVLFRAVRT
jgi:hypothetical protein